MNTCCNNIYPSEDMNRWESCPSTMLANADNYYTKNQVDEKLEDISISGGGITSGEVQSMIDAATEPIEGSVEALSGTVGQLSSDLENKADRSEIPSLSGYATEQWVESKHYLTEHQSLENYYTKGEVDNIADTKLDVTAYTPTDLSNYYTKGETNNLLDDKLDITAYTPVDLSGYATEQWVENQGYLTEHQSLSGYATTAETADINNALTAHSSNSTIHVTENDKSNWNGKANVVELTQAEYDQLATKDPDTIYIISDAPSMPPYEAGTGIAISGNVISCTVSGGGTIDLSQYYTKTETNDLLDDKLDASAYTPSDLSQYWTSAQTQSAITQATSGYATQQWVENQGYLTEHQSLSGYATTAATTNINNALTSHTSNTTVHVTQNEKNTWNSKADASNVYTKTEVNNIVNNKFWCGTQAEYEALTNKDSNILYLIHE